MPWHSQAVPGEVYAIPWSELKPVKESDGSKGKTKRAHGISWDRGISSKAKLHSKSEERDLYNCCNGSGCEDEADEHEGGFLVQIIQLQEDN